MEQRQSVSRPGGSIHSLFTFVLMAMFALLSLLIVIAGARIYRTVEAAGTDNHNSRTVVAYLANKVRASDEAGMIEASAYAGKTVLVLGGSYGGERYNTYIFHHGGAIMEYFASADEPFDPAFGGEIVPAESFAASLDGRRLTLEIGGADGKTRTVRLLLRAGEGDA